jgi:hypothetical protein
MRPYDGFFQPINCYVHANVNKPMVEKQRKIFKNIIKESSRCNSILFVGNSESNCLDYYGIWY